MLYSQEDYHQSESTEFEYISNLHLLQMLGKKLKPYSPKWWFHGDLNTVKRGKNNLRQIQTNCGGHRKQLVSVILVGWLHAIIERLGGNFSAPKQKKSGDLMEKLVNSCNIFNILSFGTSVFWKKHGHNLWIVHLHTKIKPIQKSSHNLKSGIFWIMYFTCVHFWEDPTFDPFHPFQNLWSILGSFLREEQLLLVTRKSNRERCKAVPPREPW